MPKIDQTDMKLIRHRIEDKIIYGVSVIKHEQT